MITIFEALQIPVDILAIVLISYFLYGRINNFYTSKSPRCPECRTRAVYDSKRNEFNCINVDCDSPMRIKLIPYERENKEPMNATEEVNSK